MANSDVEGLPCLEFNVLSGRLCSVCITTLSAFTRGRNRKRYGEPLVQIPHHLSEQSINDSQRDECAICVDLPARCHRALPLSWSMDTYGRKRCQIDVWMLDDEDDIRRALAVSLVREPGVPPPSLYRLAGESRACRNTGELAVRAFVQYWLNEAENLQAEAISACHRWQQNCMITTDTNYGSNLDRIKDSVVGPHIETEHPARLLELSGSQIVLRDTSSLAQIPRYATLSHCWGTKDFFRCTPDTLQALYSGVGLGCFPATFHDTILLCRHLGIDYLWIDSYCILQGSSSAAVQDWSREAPKMGSIYGHGYVNFGASNGSSPYDGLFTARESLPFKSCYIEWQDNETETKSSTTSPVWKVVNSNQQRLDRYHTRLRGGMLYSRAWVFQERKLCMRMVHFTKHEVIMEYGGGTSCESDPHPWADKILDGTFFFDGPFYSLSRHEYSWHNTVETYSQCSLTFPVKDKLVAVSSLAKLHARQQCSQDYIAGYFASDLFHSLCWDVVIPKANAPIIWQAPSWSWASLNSGVRFREKRPTTLESGQRLSSLSILDTDHATLTPGDHYGQLSFAFIKIRSSMLALHEFTVLEHDAKGSRIRPAKHYEAVFAVEDVIQRRFESERRQREAELDTFDPFYLEPLKLSIQLYPDHEEESSGRHGHLHFLPFVIHETIRNTNDGDCPQELIQGLLLRVLKNDEVCDNEGLPYSTHIHRSPTFHCDKSGEPFEVYARVGYAQILRLVASGDSRELQCLNSAIDASITSHDRIIILA